MNQGKDYLDHSYMSQEDEIPHTSLSIFDISAENYNNLQSHQPEYVESNFGAQFSAKTDFISKNDLALSKD